MIWEPTLAIWVKEQVERTCLASETEEREPQQSKGEYSRKNEINVLGHDGFLVHNLIAVGHVGRTKGSSVHGYQDDS